MNLAVYICLHEKMKGLRFESSNAKLHVSNGVGALLHIWVSTPRVGPMTCKHALQTVYRGNTRQHGPFEVCKMWVKHTVSLENSELHMAYGLIKIVIHKCENNLCEMQLYFVMGSMLSWLRFCILAHKNTYFKCKFCFCKQCIQTWHFHHFALKTTFDQAKFAPPNV